MSGRVFLFGNDIDTDQLAPGEYMRAASRRSPPIAWKASGRSSPRR